MRILVGIVLLLALTADAAVTRDQRIAGGSVTTITNYPEMVSLLYSAGSSNHRQQCVGTILTNRAILTAGHCTYGHGRDRWRARVGSTNANSGGTVYSTQHITVHPFYNTLTLDSDIAIIRTSSNIQFNNLVRAGNIAGPNYFLGDNQVVWAAGWGVTQYQGQPSEQLRHVQIWTVNQAVCRSRYAERNRQITDNMLCAGWLDVGGRDHCSRDAGGPLFHNRVVVGVSSFGVGCGDARYPGVSTRVSRFTTWIQNNA
ncbi:hypothetical protein evm_004263 [Chilo suppressalis]|nr:hypothetical protein evm_004263 [Chilo suppressalis]